MAHDVLQRFARLAPGEHGFEFGERRGAVAMLAVLRGGRELVDRVVHQRGLVHVGRRASGRLREQ